MGEVDSPTGGKKSVADALDLSAGELRELQEKDDTLVKIREAAEGHAIYAGVGFFKQDGLVYRRSTLPGCCEEYEIETARFTQSMQKSMLELGHEIPLAGHLGVEKTRQRILRRFYWPTVLKDIAELSRCCEKCQKTTN